MRTTSDYVYVFHEILVEILPTERLKVSNMVIDRPRVKEYIRSCPTGHVKSITRNIVRSPVYEKPPQIALGRGSSKTSYGVAGAGASVASIVGTDLPCGVSDVNGNGLTVSLGSE